MERFKIRLCKKEQKEAEDLGGFEIPTTYIELDLLPSCDKGGHRRRSECIQPNHGKHWKKEARRQQKTARL